MNQREKNWHGQHKAGLSRGERAADFLRNGMGSWTFVGLFVAFMAVWAAVNTSLRPPQAWDPYPFILLNLFLSMLAGLQGAILLIAAKRQDAIAAAMAQHDYETDVQAKSEIDRLMAVNSSSNCWRSSAPCWRSGRAGPGPAELPVCHRTSRTPIMPRSSWSRIWQ